MDAVKIGERLRNLRGDQPREAVALAVGVTAQAVANYETGARIPADEIKLRLAEHFGKTVQELFYD